jgi:hypothetical protein
MNDFFVSTLYINSSISPLSIFSCVNDFSFRHDVLIIATLIIFKQNMGSNKQRPLYSKYSEQAQKCRSVQHDVFSGRAAILIFTFTD